MRSKYLGYLTIVAGVFVAIAGGCVAFIGMALGESPALLIAPAVGIAIIIIGTRITINAYRAAARQELTRGDVSDHDDR